MISGLLIDMLFRHLVTLFLIILFTIRLWRTLLSVIGYTFRSIAPLSLLLVNSTAFFSDIAFGFDENYAFYRGALGYVAFIVPFFYLLLILWHTLKYVSEKHGLEKYITPVSAVFCISCAIVDACYGGTRINEAILICGIFFYIFLYAYDNRKDPLTGLLNRSAFYDDCNNSGQNIKSCCIRRHERLKGIK